MSEDPNLYPDIALDSIQELQKRLFDLCLGIPGLLLFSWVIAIAWVIAAIDTRRNGFFVQRRVGQHGRLFDVIKIRTMRDVPGLRTTVTTDSDPRITAVGRLFRKLKIDELPQLINVVIGDMSFVGPRPDMPGYADVLEGEDRVILSVRPGITGPATLKYRDEEKLLADQVDPEAYNRDVIYPDKIQINKEYVRDWCLLNDIKYIWQTISGS
jgi:lipopolysaccharide/colanic/teichoic acid biosynthesis glycosyltransferase